MTDREKVVGSHFAPLARLSRLASGRYQRRLTPTFVSSQIGLLTRRSADPMQLSPIHVQPLFEREVGVEKRALRRLRGAEEVPVGWNGRNRVLWLWAQGSR